MRAPDQTFKGASGDARRGLAARLSPGFYRGLGRDPAAVIEAGKAALRERFEAMR